MTTPREESPRDLGYVFPDEWEQHAGTMMIFPARHSYGRKTDGLRDEFAAIVDAIAENEPVVVFCFESELEDCRYWLEETRQKNHLTIHASDAFRIDWARDTAPMVLVNEEDGKSSTAGFRFNGWGKKYWGWKRDVDSRDAIARHMGWPIFHSELVLEGGSIEIGGGTGIVTESCVLNPNRTDWSKADVEEELKEMLGLDRIIWIKSGLMPDKVTDGHVDGLLKFIDEDTVMLHTTDRRRDVNYKICQEAKEVLESAGLTVIELPLMDDMVHMNFYIGSGGDVVYVPICGDPEQDEPALAVIRKHFRTVVPVVASNIGKAGGGIHCYTQQIPLGG